MTRNSAGEDRFSRATGRNIDQWAELISAHGALEDMPHKEMAALAEKGGASPWWAQGIAVELERAIGRREVGQLCTGDFAASASKTVPGTWTEVFPRLAEYLDSTPGALPGEVDGESSTSETEKWRYWRARFADGTNVTVMVNDGAAKGVAKTKIAVQHEKLASQEVREAMKAHWKAILGDFAATLA